MVLRGGARHVLNPPLTPQHYRYINRMAKFSSTYIASEAPLLLSQVALVDPEDR